MKNLKVGDTFEVVEVLSNNIDAPVGSFGVVAYKDLFTEVFCNNAWHTESYGTVALMHNYEVKPIGKLIVKKLKKPL